MIAKVFQLNDLTARDLMLPRVSASLSTVQRGSMSCVILLSDDFLVGGAVRSR